MEKTLRQLMHEHDIRSVITRRPQPDSADMDTLSALLAFGDRENTLSRQWGTGSDALNDVTAASFLEWCLESLDVPDDFAAYCSSQYPMLPDDIDTLKGDHQMFMRDKAQVREFLGEHCEAFYQAYKRGLPQEKE